MDVSTVFDVMVPQYSMLPAPDEESMVQNATIVLVPEVTAGNVMAPELEVCPFVGVPAVLMLDAMADDRPYVVYVASMLVTVVLCPVVAAVGALVRSAMYTLVGIVNEVFPTAWSRTLWDR